MAKFSPKVLFVIALLLSAVTAMLVYNFLVKSGTKPPKMGVPVVVAKVNIPPKTRITVDMLERAEVPSEYVQPGAMSDADAVAGIMARGLIVAGEQITEQRLAVKGKGDGFSGIVPPNMRAVTVAVTEVTGVAGFVKAGDTVDLVATFDQSTAGEDSSRIILQNVQVLAVDRETEVPINTNGSEEENKGKKEMLKTSTVTLAVTPEQATALTVADEKGKLRLVLRPYLPGEGIVLTETVTPKDLVGRRYKPETVAPSPQPAPVLPPPSTGGIQMIRGTKIETIPIR